MWDVDGPEWEDLAGRSGVSAGRMRAGVDRVDRAWLGFVRLGLLFSLLRSGYFGGFVDAAFLGYGVLTFGVVIKRGEHREVVMGWGL